MGGLYQGLRNLGLKWCRVEHRDKKNADSMQRLSLSLFRLCI